MTEPSKQAWAQQLLRARQRAGPSNFQTFLGLLDTIRGDCDLFVARTLMATFSDGLEDDGGQEAVNEVLSGAEAEVRIHALLEDLPRIELEAGSWLEPLIENEVRFHSDALVKVAREAAPASRALLLT